MNALIVSQLVILMLAVRINILCPSESVCVQPNLNLCPAILLTEVGMYANTS